MSQHFEVGELAKYVGPIVIGAEGLVRVIGPLEFHNRVLCLLTGQNISGERYTIERLDGALWKDGKNEWYAAPHLLRKLSPPRDDLEVVRWSDVPHFDPTKEPA